MFSLTASAKKSSQLVIIPDNDGLAIVDVKLIDQKPHLQLCDYTQWKEGNAPEKTLAEKAQQLHLKKRHCSTVIQLEDYSIFSVEAPTVPDDELQEAIRWQIKDLVDFDIDSACIETFPAPHGSGINQKQQLYVVVTQRNILQQQVDQVRLTNTELDIIDIPELVLRNIAALLPESDAGVTMVYLTEKRGMVLISRRGQLYFARTMEVGLDALVAPCSADEGLSLSNAPAFDHLVLEIQRSLDYYDRYFSQPPVGGIVFTPLLAEPAGLLEHISNSLDLPVRQLRLTDFMTFNCQPSQQEQARCLIAIGAALRKSA